MTIGGGEWTLWREGQSFPQQFTAWFEDDGQKIVGRWETAEDRTNYATDFHLIYTRHDWLFSRGRTGTPVVNCLVAPNGCSRLSSSTVTVAVDAVRDHGLAGLEVQPPAIEMHGDRVALDR